MSDALQQLYETIQSRHSDDPAVSYVASLEQAGLDKILEKSGRRQ